MAQGLTSLNSSANTGIISQAIAAKDAVNCYPPIGGPAQTRKLQFDALSAIQAAQLRRGKEGVVRSTCLII